MYSFSAYVNYFRDLATKFKPIGHSELRQRFAVMGITDILSNAKGPMDTTNPCMILERPEGALTFRNDALMDESLGAFYLIKHVGRKDPAALLAVHDEMKALAHQIILRMQYEKKERSRSNKTFPFHSLFFQLDRVKYFPIGPIMDQCYGWRIEVDLTDTSPLTFDLNDWTDLEEPDPDPTP